MDEPMKEKNMTYLCLKHDSEHKGNGMNQGI